MFTPDQSLGDKQAMMTQGAARAIARQATAFSRKSVMGDRGKPTGFNGQSFGVMDAIVTTPIIAQSGATFGTGMIQLYFYDSSISTTALQPDPTGDDGAGNTAVVNAVYPGYIGNGTWVKVCLSSAGWSLMPPPVPAPGLPPLYIVTPAGGIPAATANPGTVNIPGYTTFPGDVWAYSTYAGLYKVQSAYIGGRPLYNMYLTSVAAGLTVNVQFNYERPWASGFGSYTYISKA